jgi:hypothetical protein
VRVLNAKSNMSENALPLLRALAGAASSIAVVAILAGCTAERRSLKDDLTPAVAAYRAEAPAVTEVSSSGHVRPHREPAAKASVDSYPSDCGPVSGCLARLKALLADPSRKWVGQPQTPSEHADGTRQFAYSALRRDLSCRELQQAIDDIVSATKRLRLPIAGVTSERVVSVRSLNSKVEAELRAERDSRCNT